MSIMSLSLTKAPRPQASNVTSKAASLFSAKSEIDPELKPITVNDIHHAIKAFQCAFQLESTRFDQEADTAYEGQEAAHAPNEEATATTIESPSQRLPVGVSEEEAEILTRLPKARSRKHVRSLAELMKGSYVLRQLPLETREALCRVAGYLSIAEGSAVYKRGTKPDGVYFILQGTVGLFLQDEGEGMKAPLPLSLTSLATTQRKKFDVCKEVVEDEDEELREERDTLSASIERDAKERSHLATYHSGHALGEAALTGVEPRSSTAIAMGGNVDLMYLSVKDYHLVMRAIQAEDLLALLCLNPAARTEAQVASIIKGMAPVDLGFEVMGKLSLATQEGLCKALTCRKYIQGEGVYGRCFDRAEGTYFPDHGTCDGVMVIVDAQVEVTNRHLSAMVYKKTQKRGNHGTKRASIIKGMLLKSASLQTSPSVNLISVASMIGTKQNVSVTKNPGGAGGIPRSEVAESIVDVQSKPDADGSAESAGSSGKDEEHDEREVLAGPEWFGDLSGVESGGPGKIRAARVLEAGYIIKLAREDYLGVLQAVMEGDSEKQRALIDMALWAQPTLGHDFLSKISACLTSRVVRPGECIAKQGSRVDEIFFIVQGEMLVLVDLRVKSTKGHARTAQSDSVSSGMPTPRGGGVTKSIPLPNAARLECVGLIDSLDANKTWQTSYLAQHDTTILIGSAHKLMPLLERVVNVASGKQLVVSKKQARAEAATRGLARLERQGWVPIQADEALVSRLTGLAHVPPDLPSKEQLAKSPLKPNLVDATIKQAPVGYPEQNPSTFRFHLAEITAICVQEAASPRPLQASVMRQIGLFVPPDPLKYSRQTRRTALSSPRECMPAWLPSRAPSRHVPTESLSEREQIGTPASRHGHLPRMSFGRVFGGNAAESSPAHGDLTSALGLNIVNLPQVSSPSSKGVLGSERQ